MRKMGLFKDKRAMEEGVNVIRVLVLCLIVAIPIIIFAVKFIATGQSAGNNEACRLSIIAASLTKEGTQLVSDDTLHLNCPVETVKIKKRDVSKGNEVSWNLLNRVIATELYNCYMKTAKAKYNPFEKTAGSNSYCIVCSYLEFPDMTNVTLAGLDLYLAAKKIPGQKMSFYEAVYGKPVDSSVLLSLKNAAESGGITYTLSRPHVILWRLATESLATALAGGAAAGAGVGVAVGATVGTVVPLIGNAIGAAGGAIIGGIVGGVVGVFSAWFGSDQEYTSEYMIVPESALAMNFGQLFGGESTWDQPASTAVQTAAGTVAAVSGVGAAYEAASPQITNENLADAAGFLGAVSGTGAINEAAAEQLRKQQDAAALGYDPEADLCEILIDMR